MTGERPVSGKLFTLRAGEDPALLVSMADGGRSWSCLVLALKQKRKERVAACIGPQKVVIPHLVAVRETAESQDHVVLCSTGEPSPRFMAACDPGTRAP